MTGIGAVTPFGLGAQALWDGLCAGRTCIAETSTFDASGFPCSFSAQVPEYKIRDHVPKHYRKATKVMARDIELAVIATDEAIRHAGIVTAGTSADDTTPATYPRERTACLIGAGLIAADVDELSAALVTATDDAGGFSASAWGERGMDNLTPLWLLKTLPNMLACHVTIVHEAKGPSNTIVCAESSGLLSVGEAMRVIERGDADAAMTGSAESKVNPMGMIRWDLAGMIAHADQSAAPDTIVRPFDPDGPGGVLGEGGGMMILEEKDAADRRGARALARCAGFAGGHCPTQGDPAHRARGLVRAIRAALTEAGIGPEHVSCVLPTALGVPAHDAVEAHALRTIFADALSDVELVTIAPAIGNLVAGHGGVLACLGATILAEQKLPARLHTGTPALGLNAGPAEARAADVEYALIVTHAVGGSCAALVLARPDAV